MVATTSLSGGHHILSGGHQIKKYFLQWYQRGSVLTSCLDSQSHTHSCALLRFGSTRILVTPFIGREDGWQSRDEGLFLFLLVFRYMLHHRRHYRRHKDIVYWIAQLDWCQWSLIFLFAWSCVPLFNPVTGYLLNTVELIIFSLLHRNKNMNRNSLPNSVVDASTVNAFKARLDKFWSHQAVKFDFTAVLTGTGNRSEEFKKW